LSACETGVGQLLPGEGLNSLSRAFEFAGCPNIVPSLWQIDDKATAAIMETFYKELAAGSPKDLALRKAKLAYLDQAIGTEGHPFYWAGNILIGDATPVVLHNDTASFWFILLLATAITGLLWWFAQPQ
jgi:CHAT domain-containing protein